MVAPVSRLTDSETSLTTGVKNQTQFVHVERERAGWYTGSGERGKCTEKRSGQRNSDSISGSTTDEPQQPTRERERELGAEIVPLVDVATPKPIRMGRTKPYRVEANPVIEGTWVDYWMWLCRPNPHDTEPKPLPLIPTQK